MKEIVQFRRFLPTKTPIQIDQATIYCLLEHSNFSLHAIVGFLFLSLYFAVSRSSSSRRPPSTSHTEHHTLNITHSTSHTPHHTFNITHSISHTQHHTHLPSHIQHHTHPTSHSPYHTLNITHSTSHIQHHTFNITHPTSHSPYHTLNITHSTSHTRYQTLNITHSTSDTQFFLLSCRAQQVIAVGQVNPKKPNDATNYPPYQKNQTKQSTPRKQKTT